MSALFSKKKSEDISEKSVSLRTKSSSQSKKEKGGVAVKGVSGRALSASILLEPVITEKAHAVSGQNKYVFLVASNANKGSIKHSIEELYGVHVVKVSVSVMKPRKRVFGRTVGMTKGRKKTVVTVKKGQSIDLFKGV